MQKGTALTQLYSDSEAIHVWIYADEVVAEGEAWGHRAMCFDENR